MLGIEVTDFTLLSLSKVHKAMREEDGELVCSCKATLIENVFPVAQCVDLGAELFRGMTLITIPVKVISICI